MPEHCVITVDGSDVVLIPLDGARSDDNFLVYYIFSQIMQSMSYEFVLDTQSDQWTLRYHCIYTPVNIFVLFQLHLLRSYM